jgi:hypothetical protein
MQYLEPLARDNRHFLTTQQLPTDTTLYTAEKYLDFLAERRNLLAARLNEFLSLRINP